MGSGRHMFKTRCKNSRLAGWEGKHDNDVIFRCCGSFIVNLELIQNFEHGQQNIQRVTETYSKPCQTSNMELLAKIVND